VSRKASCSTNIRHEEEKEEDMRIARVWAAAIAVVCLGLATSTAALQAAPVTFTVPLTGAQQVPPVSTAGTGTAKLTYDPTTRLLTWNVAYSGLSGPATMAHFHGPAPAGKNAGVLVWISKMGSPVTSPIDGSVTLTPAQAKQFEAGHWYVNVHTKLNPSGEIRGQVLPPKS
jgi:hypothetical protein